MNIFVHELKSFQKSTITWTCSLVGILVMFMFIFPTIAKDTEFFVKMMEGFPVEVRNALGLHLDQIGSILGFYSYVFGYITLCGAIQAMKLGTSIISREINNKTADFLMTKPVSRVQILTSKLAAMLALLMMTNAVYLTASLIMAAQVALEDYDVGTFLMMSSTLLFVQLMFLAIGMMVSVTVRKIKSVIAVSLGTVFMFYIIGMFIANDGATNTAKRYFTPFKYFDTAYIMEHSRYEITYLIAAIILITTWVSASYMIFIRKDIHAV